jgi:hypothetical protein
LDSFKKLQVPKSDKVDDLVRSEDIFFFISYAQERSQEKKRVVEASVRRPPAIPPLLQQTPNCLQDVRFLMDFFIEHHQEKKPGYLQSQLLAGISQNQLARVTIPGLRYFTSVTMFRRHGQVDGTDTAHRE